MIDLLHTFDCPIPGYEGLQITVNLGLRDQDVLDGWTRGENVAVTGFPNWTGAASRFGWDAVEPSMPLTMETARRTFPIIMSAYLTGYDVINDGLRDYMGSSRPFLKAR